MRNMDRNEPLEHEYAMAWRAGTAPDIEAAEAVAIAGSTKEGIGARFAREWAAAWAACGTFEYVALSYLGISCALILFFAENLAHPLRLIGMQVFVSAAILGLCRVEARVSRGAQFGGEERQETDSCVCPTFAQRFWHFWRHWYPHLYFLFCFEELGRLVHLVQPGWQDAKLIAFDHWLTGVHPTVWLEQFATPARNDFMQFVYLTYFTYLLVVGGILYYRRDWRGYWSVMTYSAVGYAIGYVIAIFFPIESPWFSMAGAWHAPLQGGAATAVINFIEHYGRVRGAAFPSEHVAGAVAATWGAWRHRRWLFWAMLPLVACMCVSTVWGRYHYVADVLGGLITGTLGYVIGAWLMRRRSAEWEGTD
ncbi:MAG: phosphatase PAP2 family protein [Candidatus Acidiferrum sp.]